MPRLDPDREPVDYKMASFETNRSQAWRAVADRNIDKRLLAIGGTGCDPTLLQIRLSVLRDIEALGHERLV